MKEFLSESVKSFLGKEILPMFIGGEEHFGSGETLSVINPATEELICKVPSANVEEVDQAVMAAAKAFHNHWSKISPSERELYLLKLADALEEKADDLAQIITLENGKPIAEAKSSDVLGAAKTFRYFAGWCTKITGDTLDLSMKQKPGNQNFGMTLKEPVGVVAAIVPWNFPISIASWKIAPALAAGCTVVLKPSEETPISALFLARLIDQVGFPPGVLNVITGNGPDTGSALVNHPKINKIAFTGSTQTGIAIGKAAIQNLISASLELGGKSPGIVFADADLDNASRGIAAGIFRNAGQVCVAGSRLYVQDKVFDQFVEMVATQGKNMTISHGFDPKCEIGPLVSSSHFDKVSRYIGEGKTNATLVSGGNRALDTGYYIEPTVFSSKTNNQLIIKEEIFGPVLVAVPFTDKNDALVKANDSDFGLAGTIWTKDIDKALSCIKAMDAGFIGVNGPVRSDPNLPLNGFKHSGLGIDLGKDGLNSYLRTKAVNIVFGD